MKAWWRAKPSKQGQSTWPCILALLTIPLVGILNYYSGAEISFVIFYLPSIALVGWLGGSAFGIGAAIMAASAWLLADLESGQSYSNPGLAYWNTALRFVVFLLFGLLFAILRQTRDSLRQGVTQKTLELQKEISERLRIQREVAEIFSNQQRQIAYDLHDGVGQHLSGIAFKSKLLEQELRRSGSKYAEEAAAITDLINDALRQTRLVARSTESSYGEAQGLNDALRKLAEELRQNSGISAVANVDQSAETVGAPVDMQLFRIAQEASHNATKHAEARNIEIGLQTNDEGILLTVRDDGKGFANVPAGDGMGMRTMKYRAQTIGGLLVVTSKPGTGTTVSCRVPRRPAEGKSTTKLLL